MLGEMGLESCLQISLAISQIAEDSSGVVGLHQLSGQQGAWNIRS